MGKPKPRLVHRLAGSQQTSSDVMGGHFRVRTGGSWGFSSRQGRQLVLHVTSHHESPARRGAWGHTPHAGQEGCGPSGSGTPLLGQTPLGFPTSRALLPSQHSTPSAGRLRPVQSRLQMSSRLYGIQSSCWGRVLAVVE